MAEKVSECIILSKFVKASDICQICIAHIFPSYYERGKRRGCWVAHTALCILEASLIKAEITSILKRKGVTWDTLILTLVLHDIGKLSKEYVSGRPYEVHHNEVSAQISYDILNKLIGNSIARVISQACFLHMEPYIWKEVHRGGLSSIGQATSPGYRVEMAESLNYPLSYLLKWIDEIGVKVTHLQAIINKLLQIKRVKLQPSIYSFRILPEAISLHWFIRLIDNRASSARSGVNRYWLTIIQDIAKLIDWRSGDKILEFSKSALNNLGIILTPMPNFR